MTDLLTHSLSLGLQLLVFTCAGLFLRSIFCDLKRTFDRDST
jgi:hypothetical protein